MTNTTLSNNSLKQYISTIAQMEQVKYRQEKAIETKDYKIAITDEQKEALQEFNEENSRNRGHEKLAVKTQKKSKVAVPSDKLEGALMSSFNKPKKKTKVAVKHQDKNKNGKRDNTQYKNRASSLSDTFSK